MTLGDIIDLECIVCDKEIASKKRALEMVSELLANQYPYLKAIDIFNSLLTREKLGSTAMGKGVAIPHARIPEASKAMGAFIKIPQGIDFDSPDHQAVDIIFALLVPEHFTNEHLQLLASIARVFSDEDLCDRIRNSHTRIELHQILSEQSTENS